MSQRLPLNAGDLSPDPFSERTSTRRSLDFHVLGAHVRFSSDSEALLAVAASAYAGLPSHTLPIDPPTLHIELRLAAERSAWAGNEPPAVSMQSGAGFLCGVMDASNYAVLFPEQRRALVVASPDLLEQPYYLRYELIEFCVFTLATRALGLAPLHGACVGRQGRGALVMGASGAGKSTLALHSLLHGLEFLSEDAVFVHPPSGRVTGVANYLHVQADALRFVEDAQQRQWIEQSPTIRRRSGVRKYEVDLRCGHGRLAASLLELACVVFVSRQPAEHADALMQALPEHEWLPRLIVEQPYAASQPGWDALVRLVQRCGAYELKRGRHPDDSVAALLQTLA